MKKLMLLLITIFFIYTLFKITIYSGNIIMIFVNIVLIAMLTRIMRYSHNEKNKTK